MARRSNVVPLRRGILIPPHEPGPETRPEDADPEVIITWATGFALVVMLSLLSFLVWGIW